MARSLMKYRSSWICSTLAAYSEMENQVINKAQSGTTPKTINDKFWGGEHFWLTPKEITKRNGELWVTRTERTLTNKGIASCSLRIHPPGTVFLSKRAPVGLVAINAVPMAINQGFIALECTEIIRPLYLAHWLIANNLYFKSGSKWFNLFRTIYLRFV